MTEEAKPELRSVGLATALVITGNLVAFAAVWSVATIMSGNVAGLARWYTEGGLFMHPVGLMAFVALAAGIGLGIVHVRRPLPMVVHLAAPAMAFLLGWFGAWMGLQQGSEAAKSAPPDMIAELWARILSIMDAPHQLGLLVAGCTVGPMVVTGAMTAFVRRGGAPRGPAVIVGAAAVVATIVTSAALVVTQALAEVSFVSVYLIVAVVGCGALMAMAAPGAAALAKGDHSALGVGAAVMCAVGAVLALLAQGSAMVGWGLGHAYTAIADAPPDMKMAMVAAGATQAKLAGFCTTVAVAAVAVVGGVLVGQTVPGAGAWLRQRAMSIAAAALVVLPTFGLEALLDTLVHRGHHELITKNEVQIPEGMELPESDTELVFDPKFAVVAVVDGELLVNRQPAPDLSTKAGLAEMAQRLAPREWFEPPPQRAQPKLELSSPPDREKSVVAQSEREKIAEKFKKLFGGGSGGSLLDEPAGPPPVVFSLALAPDARWSDVAPLLDRLRPLGELRIKLLTRPPGRPTGEERAMHEEAFGDIGVLDDLVFSMLDEPKVVNVVIDHPFDFDPDRVYDKPPLLLALNLTASGVRIAGSGAVLDPPIGRSAGGGYDHAALLNKLVEIKDAFPEERHIMVHDSGGNTVQEIVRITDTSREVEDPGGEMRYLFDEPVLVTPGLKEAQPMLTGVLVQR